MPEILIVEDEALVAHDLELTLERMGYGVSGVAASADEALRLAGEQRPDLVLMDIRIRGERDGIETAALLRERHDFPIVYLTAYADDQTVGRAKHTEPHGYVLKPWNPAELRSTVEIALHKHAVEARLRESQRWLATTLAAIDDAVVAVGPDGAVTFMNARAVTLLEIPDREARGRSFVDVMPLVDADTGERIPDVAGRAMLDRRPVRLPANTRLRDRYVEDSAAPILTDEGELLGAVLVFRDTTEERRLRDQLARHDRLRALGTLAAGVGHELGSPLAYVHGNVAFALEALRDLRDELVRAGNVPARLESLIAALEEATHGTDRLREITGDLRTFARPTDEPREPVELAGCAAWAIRVTAREVTPVARVTTDFGAAPPVLASEARIGQVLVNLLVNAAHALPPGRVDRNEITVRTRTDAQGRAVVEVSDNGSGIPAERLGRIFDPFFTTKDAGRGSGLGLAVSRNIVEALGGEIRVESEPGRGTTFEVVLPPASDGAHEAASRAPGETTPSTDARARVLVVDDEPLVRSMLTRTLQGRHDLLACADGAEALALLEQDADFDVILCDLTMPGMDGRALFETLRDRMPELAQRLVFMTGGATDEATDAFLDAVPNERLVKPASLRALRSLVARYATR